MVEAEKVVKVVKIVKLLVWRFVGAQLIVP
jgi:hypothetical protein